MVASHLKTGSRIRRPIPKADLREVAEIRLGIITAAMSRLARDLNTGPRGFKMLDRRLTGGPYYLIGDRVYAVGRDTEVPLGRLNITAQSVLESRVVYAVGFLRPLMRGDRYSVLPQRFDLEQLSLVTADKVTEFWSDAMTGRLAQIEFRARPVKDRLPKLQ